MRTRPAVGVSRALPQRAHRPAARRRRAPRATSSKGGTVCQWTRPPRQSLAAEEAIASGRAERPRSHSCPTHSSRAAGPPALVARGGSLAAMRRNVAVRPVHQVGASHARSVRLTSGTGSRVGMGMGMGQRADELAGSHPVNRSQLGRRRELAARSRPIARRLGARFGHGPATASDQRAQAGRERRTRGRSAGRDINVWPRR